MGDDQVVDRVRSRTTDLPGRSLNQARANHFVIDSSSGTPQAMTSIEAFLSGISSCAVNVIHREATERGLALQRAEVLIESRRAKADTSTILGVDMEFRLAGVSRAEAEELVGIYTRR